VEIPENVYQAMRAGALAWQKFVVLAKANDSKRVWTKEQTQQWALLAEVVTATHNALLRLLEANDS